jgi:aspartate aminotransferase
VPGIQGRRISLETASKVWNACGLRVGALVTDNEAFHRKAVAENTACLCPNVIGQYVFAGLCQESHADLRAWYDRLRGYYREMLLGFSAGMRELAPEAIVSSPDASIYSVVDVRRMVDPDFDALDFVHYCASRGAVDLGGRPCTLLTAPMSGFYTVAPGQENPGRTQMRVAYVVPPEEMAHVPYLLVELLKQYEARRAER